MMNVAARLLLLLAAILLLPACRTRPRTTTVPKGPAAPPTIAADALLPSPRLIIGRILAVDTARQFAFVDLASDAPLAAATAGTELLVRTPDLRETARLQASRYVRGRTLGTNILSGQPTPGDEVVWQAP